MSRSASTSRLVLPTGALWLLVHAPAAAQIPGPTLYGPTPNPAFFDSPDFGDSIATITDASGVTTAIVTVGDAFLGGPETETLELYETSGARRWTRMPPVEFNDYANPFITGLPDLDGDLVDDVLVGLGFDGVAELLSGADGSRIDLVSSPTPLVGGSFGKRVASMGDMDGDGAVEFTVEGDVGLVLYRFVGGASVPVTFLAGRHAAALRGPTSTELVVDSSFDTRFYTLTGSQLSLQRTHPERPFWIVSAGDVTGDGRDDLVMNRGIDVAMLDGATLAVVWAKDDSGKTLSTGFSADISYGITIAAGQDLNGNGSPDVAVCDSGQMAEHPGSFEGAIFLYEGSTGQELGVVYGTAEFTGLGGTVALTSTFLGNQVPTLLAGVNRPGGGLTFPATRAGEIRSYRLQPSAAPYVPRPVLQVDRIDDEYTVSGAPASSLGFVGASTGTTTFAGQTVIDFNAPALLGIFPVPFDADGVMRVPLPTAGFPSFYLQAADSRPVISAVAEFTFF